METKGLSPSLRDYFRILCYWKGTVITFFLTVVLSTVIITLNLPPVYEAFTLILIEKEPRRPVMYKSYEDASIPPRLSVAEELPEVAQTQSEIIKSRHILEKVTLALEIDKNFEPPNQVEKAVEALQDRIRVELKEETNIIRLSVEDINPKLAAEIANAIAENYVQWITEAKLAGAKSATGVISERIAVLQKELEEVEHKLTQLKKKGDVAAIREEITATVTKLADFDVEHDLTLANIKEKETKLKELKDSMKEEEGGLITTSQMISNAVIDALKLKLLDLRLKRTQLLSKYNRESSLVESIDEEVAHTKAELSKEIANVINSMEADFTAIQAKKRTLEEARDKYNNRLKQLSNVELEYKKLERDVKGKSELYLTLLGKQAEVSLTEATETNLLVNVKIIDPAKMPSRPIRPNKLLNTILGCIIGLMSGVGGAFLMEYWDHSLKTVDEIKRYLELPTLATIRRARSRVFSLYTPGSPFSETFHTLSASVQQLCKERGINTLLITSAERREGKSVVCANLAMSLASIEGKKVLIVDANMRRPTMHRFFEVDVKSNLVDVLSIGTSIKPDLTDIKNLSLISTTEEVAEPSRLLASDAMKEFIRKIKTEYDYIIIDSPALIRYPDASILSFEVEGIILVINFGETKREVIERAKSLLNKSQRKILGIVLNKVEYVIPEGLYRRL